MKVYCISGLGADHRAFKYIDFKAHEVVFLDWIDPTPNESLRSYALRMKEQITTEVPFALLGLSFGGMLVAEMSTALHPEKVILLSSLGNATEKPWYLKLGRYLPLHKLIPNYFLNHPNWIAHWMFDTSTENEKALLNQIIRDGQPRYLKWAINAIIQWDKRSVCKAHRIHGTKDRILHYKHIPASITIPNGSHFALVKNAQEVNQAILQILNK